MRRSASLESFCWAARSSMARTVSRIWNSKSLSSEASLVSRSRVRLRSSTSPSRASLARSWLSAYCCSRAALRSASSCGELVVQLVEEAGDVDLLRAEALARGGDDAGVEAEALGGLNAGRCAGHAEAQLVVGRERDFVHAGRGVEHAGGVGGVDLERGVVRGDERPRAGSEESGWRWRRRARAFFRIGGEPSSSSSTSERGRRGARGGRDW
jgi:hypothetical protein